MKEQILKILAGDSRITPEQIAVMLGEKEEDVKKAVAELENDRVIVGYHAVINDNNILNDTAVKALIELKITLQRDKGFEAVAERISNYPQVKSVYLMSGGFDLVIMMEGKTMREIAFFVAEKLATIDGVSSTATHFVLQKYKDNGIVFGYEQEDKRGNTW